MRLRLSNYGATFDTTCEPHEMELSLDAAKRLRRDLGAEIMGEEAEVDAERRARAERDAAGIETYD